MRGPTSSPTRHHDRRRCGGWLSLHSRPKGNSGGLDWWQRDWILLDFIVSKNVQSRAKTRERFRLAETNSSTIVEDADAYVQAAELNVGRGMLGLGAGMAMSTHDLKCGWRAAHASMAQDMPRSSCWPGGQL